jgi:hypothetical protein
VAVDRRGNVFVGEQGEVIEFGKDGTQPIATLPYSGNGLSYATAMTVDDGGNVYVGFTASDHISFIADIVEFPAGSTNPLVLFKNKFVEVVGLCLDRSENLYVANLNPVQSGPPSGIYVFAPNGKQPFETFNIPPLGGITLDRLARLYVPTSSTEVAIVRRGSSTPTNEITVAVANPTGVAVSPARL